jgi:hypothetical protein
MDTTALHLRFRQDCFDLKEPYLWSDVEVFHYMDAAQKMFCVKAGGIADASSDLTKATISAGDPWVSIDSRILAIRRASLASTGAKVELVSHEKLDLLRGADDYGVLAGPKLDNRAGAVRYAVTNMEQDKLRLIAVPAANDTLELLVYRLPLKPITGKGQKFEISEQHHEYLLMWMKALAYRKQDAEARNDKLAQTSEMAFLAYCEQARQDRERKEHAPREVAYGGL